MFLIKGCCIVLWFTIIPWLIGACCSSKDNRDRWMSYFHGLMVMFSIMLVLSLLWIKCRGSLTSLSVCYATVCMIIAVMGAVREVRNVREWVDDDSGKESFGTVCLTKIRTNRLFKTNSNQIAIWLVVAVILILIQMVLVAYYAHFDADDAFYVGTATTALHTDTVFQFDAYTGLPLSELPARYVLSPFPVFLAVISKLSLGLHPAIVAHVFFDAIFVGIAYAVYFMYARRWFPNNKNLQGIFLIISCVTVFFSAYARHLVGTVMLIRIWQGKAFLASVILPLLLYEWLLIFQEKNEKLFGCLFFTSMGACLLSSMAVALVLILNGLFLVIGLFQKKAWSMSLKGCLCCIPEIVLGLGYFILR